MAADTPTLSGQDITRSEGGRLPHYKLQLRDVAKELYGWQMPRGFLESKERGLVPFTPIGWRQLIDLAMDTSA